jgi:D-proline reductase (dithiol) PrdB
MAKISDLKLAFRLFMMAYPYRHVDWGTGASLTRPLGEARIAVVTTAAYFLPDQPPFDASIRGGDYSYRVIPFDAELSALGMAHRSDAFDARGIVSDKNLALPLDRLTSLARDGIIGSVAPRHISVMGSITAPGRLVAHTAPEIARMLLEDAVDAVLLTPVCPMCHQSAGLIQSIVEKAGIPTVSVTVLREITERVAPPRALFLDSPLGYPLGAPGDAALQTRIILAALALLTERVPPAIVRDFEAAR